MNIYQKMSAITTELSTVAKNLMVGEGRSSYKAVGEADVLAAVKPLEAKHGVYSYPRESRIVDAEMQTVSKSYNGKETTSTRFFLRLERVYRFVNVENPDEYVEVTTYGDGVDANDKAPGKAMTYADKYALLKAYKITTGDDPDQKKSDDQEKVEAWQRPVEDQTFYCADCGKPIENGKRKGGAVWPAAEIAAYTESFASPKRKLCYECGMVERKRQEANAAAYANREDGEGDA